jgi:sugar lactone lactonase YvrE
VRAEQLTGPDAFHAEGPVWSPAWGGLRWVDMLAGDVLGLTPDGAVTRRHVGTVAAALRPWTHGGAVIALERGFALEHADGELTTLPAIWTDPTVRFNEGGCDPDGRFYCGSMAYDERHGAGALYRLDRDGRVERVLADLTIANGLEWAPSGTTAYHVDTPTRVVSAFDYERQRGLHNRRAFVRCAPELGLPDGLTVDAQGGIWVAFFGGAAVRRYSPDGALDAIVELPVDNVTACAFGGPALDRLFVTTSRQGLAAGAQPSAGALFAADPGVRGRPVAPYAGRPPAA